MLRDVDSQPLEASGRRHIDAHRAALIGEVLQRMSLSSNAVASLSRKAYGTRMGYPSENVHRLCGPYGPFLTAGGEPRETSFDEAAVRQDGQAPSVYPTTTLS